MTLTPRLILRRLSFVLAALAGLAACRDADHGAEAPPDRLWPAYRYASGRSSDTVHVRYTVDSLGHVDSATVVVVRSTSDVLTPAVRASLLRTRFRPGVQAGQTAASHLEERFVFEHDSAAAPDSLVAVRDPTDSIPETVLGSAADSPRTMSLAWSDVREAYQAVLIPLLETGTLSDSLRGRDATICLGALDPRGRNARDTAAVGLLMRRGRDVVPIGDCRPYSGIIREGAPPPAFNPPPGAQAPVYIDPELESWTADAVWIRANVVQRHGVDVHVCEAKRNAGAWTASCSLERAFIF